MQRALSTRAIRPLLFPSLRPSLLSKSRPLVNPLLCSVSSTTIFSRHSSHHAKVRFPAPEFSAPAVINKEIVDISLSDLLKKNDYVVLLFYPMDFTFVCPTELIAFSQAKDKFAALNTQVVGISTDSEFSHLAWSKLDSKLGGLSSAAVDNCLLPLVADRSHSISKKYGVLLEDGGIALRGLFVIDKKGILRSSIINDLPIGRSVDEALRIIEAIKFTDTHGEVCPANWSAGKPSIKPSPKDSLEYFGKNQ
ncbi:hypothetical protein BB560_007129 [Smittium megazygosporum]|uniref:thioredoxin-dependent peroxiredoxin n=1 Tax=Smittium megazygosporum TaxID=133381 RepID=A0A2T9XYN9_9FUNG|nr:hypothetical protein BB560_007129 [Smittium megazygosporum]